MAYKPLTERVAKRMAEIQGLNQEPTAPPEPDYSLKQIGSMVGRVQHQGPPNSRFRQTPAQFWKSLRGLKRAGQ